MKKVNIKKRIIESDSENESVLVSSSPINTQISDDWLESRNVSRITKSQREENIVIAKQERKKKLENPSKVRRIVLDDDEDSNDDEDCDFIATPFKNLANNSSILEDTPIEKNEKSFKKLIKANAKPITKSNNIKPNTIKEFITIPDDSEEAEDEEEDDEMREIEDIDENEIKREAQMVLHACSDMTSKLRKSLAQWEGKSSDGLTFENDCVNLLNIQTTREALTQEDILRACPSLELKEYQLVGVNWLKLLYQNNINGVLADDMVIILSI